MSSLDPASAIAAAASDIVAWRRHLHAHPELSFQETETAAWIAETLRGFGLEPERPTATSVVVRIRGGHPGPTVAARADIDALPIVEENTFDFVSTRPGVMHACGHDGHTAMLLGVARALAAHRENLAGEARLIFQHAEELPPGGAQELVAAGVMDGVDAIVGAHLMSILDTGKVCVLPGPELAAADMFEVTVAGKGGHGAMPHETVDPVAIAAQLVTAINAIVARQVDPLENVVVSVTRIAGGSANNIIPETVELGGTVRTFTPELRSRTRESLERIVHGVCGALGATADFRWIQAYAAVVNDARVAALVARQAAEVVGEEAVVEIPPIMGGDDFSAYLACAPGAYALVGSRSAEAGSGFPHHHPRFTVDERALPIGAGVLLRSILALQAGEI